MGKVVFIIMKIHYLIATLVLGACCHCMAQLEVSENLSSSADASLKKLGSYLNGQLEEKDLAIFVSGEWKGVNIVTVGKIDQRVVPGDIKVSMKPVDLTGKMSDSIYSLAKWKASYGEKIHRTKFKIVRVLVNEDLPGKFTTETLMMAISTKNGNLNEVHQRWKAQWQIKGEKAQLLNMNLMSEHAAGLVGEKPLYADRTSAVLVQEKEREILLNQGANYWMQRLETALRPDFFGETGVSVADVNGDGREDVYISQLGGLPNQLFIQQQNGVFKELQNALGLDILDNTTGAVFADLDNDGDQDAVLATAGGVAIYENATSDTRTEFVLKKQFPKAIYGNGMCVADYDQDGLLDFYVCQYYATVEDKRGRENTGAKQLTRGNFPAPYPVFDATNGGRNGLYKNTGEMDFEDVTDLVGLGVSNSRYSYAAMWEDWDNDGDQDLYVVNDFGPNIYYRNEGGTFLDASQESGLVGKAFGMGVTSGDYNGDGWMDIHVSNMFSSAGSRVTRQKEFKSDSSPQIKRIFELLARGNTLMVNKAGKFEDSSEESGITVGRWSWGCLSPDINNDGYEDLLVANGFVTGKEKDDL